MISSKYTLSQEELEKYLWGAAILLRGYIDASDYKQFIFPLLFFKRICDVYDEEYEQALKEYGDEESASFPENHRFQIPRGAHWRDVRNATSNVGMAIQRAMREIEKANPDTLAEIFGDAPWTNKNRLSDETLRNLIEHFSSQNLSISRVPQDELGQGYEYLIKRFADDSGHSAAEFYTNRTLVRLMTLMLDPKEGESIYDPTCGSGGMLLIAALQLKEHEKEYRSLKLYGQDVNLITSSIARMNLFLHGINDFKIIRGDTLSQPAFLEKDHLKQFDVILANPPYSIKKWDRDLFTVDPYGRNVYGVPPQGRADYTFFQHILKSMDPIKGRCAILFPHGVLFREDEQKMRESIVEADVIECVLGLGPNLFYNSSMEACVIVCRMRKPIEHRRKILFINAVNEIAREKTQSFLEERHREKILEAYRNFKDVDGFAKVATLEEIQANKSRLNIIDYVRPTNSQSHEKQLCEILTEWESRSRDLQKSLEDLYSLLKQEGFYGQ
jgi:type I restriction enzyme M protein